jgi:hypothetical protein
VSVEGEPVYRSDPDPVDDSGFEPGRLRHLVAGRQGRLLDPRRTPVRVCAVDLDRGFFDVELLAFEDAGAHWLVAFEGVDRYQFGPGPDADAELVQRMQARSAALNRPLTVPAAPAARDATLRRLAAERAAAGDLLDRAGLAVLDLDPLIGQRFGDPAAFAVLDDFLRERDLTDIDEEFVRTFVSNPHSGEVVKGHAIVLAELGLCPFSGTAVRDPALFGGRWTRRRRARHLLARMAFAQALFERAPTPVVLFRGRGVDAVPAAAIRPASFVSASLSLDVALAHFQGRPAQTSTVLFRRPVPRERLVMTFVETAAMNHHFREAEAVLVADPQSATF